MAAMSLTGVERCIGQGFDFSNAMSAVVKTCGGWIESHRVGGGRDRGVIRLVFIAAWARCRGR